MPSAGKGNKVLPLLIKRPYEIINQHFSCPYCPRSLDKQVLKSFGVFDFCFYLYGFIVPSRDCARILNDVFVEYFSFDDVDNSGAF